MRVKRVVRIKNVKPSPKEENVRTIVHKGNSSLLLFGAIFIGIALFFAYFIGTINLSHAEKFFVQSAYGESYNSQSVSAEFRREPVQGDLLIAVLASDSQVVAPAPVGWMRVENSNGNPSQSMYYKYAGGNEPKEVSLHGASVRGDFGLHIYEYRGIVPLSAPVMHLEESGFGTTAAIGEGVALKESGFMFAATTARGRLNIYDWDPKEFSSRNNFETKGSRAVSVVGGDVTIPANSDGNWLEMTFAKRSDWTMDALIFRINNDLSLAQSAEEYASNVEISTQVNARNPNEGDQIEYTVQVTNTDDAAIHNVDVLLPLPKAVRLQSASFTHGTYFPVVGLWNIDTLEPGEVASLSFQAIVQPLTANTSFLFRSTVTYFDEMDLTKDPAWDAVILDVTGKVRLQADSLEKDCPVIGSPTVKINGGAELAGDDQATLAISGSNATYALLNETPDFINARYASLGTNQPYVLTDEEQQTAYVWLMSTCDRAPIVEDSILIDLTATVEDEETGEEEESAEETDSPAEEEEESEAEEVVESVPEEEQEEIQVSEGTEETEEEEILSACAPSSPISQYLYIGLEGGQVASMQSALICYGFYSGAVTGIFDQASQTALSGFQSSRGLSPTGAADLLTREALNGF